MLASTRHQPAGLAGLFFLDLRQIPDDIPYSLLDNILWIAWHIQQ